MKNPLLDFTGLPRFADIRAEHITPALTQLLAENQAIVASVRASGAMPAWGNLVQPLADANERLSRAWGQVSHLNAVANNPELRKLYNANLPLVTQYFAELAQDQTLFEKFKQLRNQDEYNRLSGAQKMILEHELRDFRLGGAELGPTEKKRFLLIQEELSALSSRFNDNLLDATNHFTLAVDNPEELSGIPHDAVHAAREIAKNAGDSGWKFTLHAPSYLPVMQYADHRKLRENMYRAYSTRASENSAASPVAGDWDNTSLIGRILQLRREEARLLGFESYAELSLATKMASTPEQVLEFLYDLAAKARPHAERDYQELCQFAAKTLQLKKLEAWDLAYASEKLRIDRYAFSEQEVRQYFPETTVLPGMFKLVEDLYGIRIAPVEGTDRIQRWNDDVKFFNISNSDGELIGQFYLDLYARPGKRSGAWMDDAVTRRRLTNKNGGHAIQTPVAYLNCNFSPPLVHADGSISPALLTHDEVLTLFHEFGHGLHHLLTEMEDLGVSGINGVEWDAVELPSQIMENFCWEWEVVRNMTKHAVSGEKVPRNLFEKMLAAKNFQSGLSMLRQLEFSLFDMHLHFDFDPDGGNAQQLLDGIRQKVAVIIPPAFNRFPNSFSHIFGGGYAAGYYSYKWAEVLSADAYSMFEECNTGGMVSQETGIRFREEVLAVGGSRPALDSFIAFRGRKPDISALLRHNGMTGS
jgi:oligopeptidase A